MALTDFFKCHTSQLHLARSSTSRHNHLCPFCSRSFSRVDGAKRHTRSCRSRGDRLLPPDAKRGRKAHACDVCSRLKVSCDSKSPCARCSLRDLSCTYGWTSRDSSHHLSTISSGEPTSMYNSSLQLAFLLAYTDPSVGPGVEVVLSREPDPELALGQTAMQKVAESQYTMCDTIDPRLLNLDFINPFFDFEVDSNSTNSRGTTSALGSTDLDLTDEKLRARLCQLEADIRDVASGVPCAQDISETTSWAEFCAISSFHECIMTFFQREELLATIIHEPTFSPEHVDTTLLFAIAICGYIYNHCQKGNASFDSFSSVLRELGEKYIFRSVEHLLGCPSPLPVSLRSLEICQAAYIIETLQFCVKDSRTRQRIVTRCHPMLVDLLRSLDIVGSSHSLSEAEVDWHTFAYTESSIRLLHWVFINDAWFTLFSNRSPAMTFSDMSGHLPCEDRLWKANSPATFDSFRLQQRPSSNSSSLDALVVGLLGEDWTESTMASYTRLPLRHFLILILAFQHIIFYHHSTALFNTSSNVLLRALDRWAELWDNSLSRADPETRESLGLVKHSPELAYLSRRILEFGAAKKDVKPGYLQRKVTFDTTVLHQFVRQCAN